jgi:hypothetical protein
MESGNVAPQSNAIIFENHEFATPQESLSNPPGADGGSMEGDPIITGENELLSRMNFARAPKDAMT